MFALIRFNSGDLAIYHKKVLKDFKDYVVVRVKGCYYNASLIMEHDSFELLKNIKQDIEKKKLCISLPVGHCLKGDFSTLSRSKKEVGNVMCHDSASNSPRHSPALPSLGQSSGGVKRKLVFHEDCPEYSQNLPESRLSLQDRLEVSPIITTNLINEAEPGFHETDDIYGSHLEIIEVNTDVSSVGCDIEGKNTSLFSADNYGTSLNITDLNTVETAERVECEIVLPEERITSHFATDIHGNDVEIETNTVETAGSVGYDVLMSQGENMNLL